MKKKNIIAQIKELVKCTHRKVYELDLPEDVSVFQEDLKGFLMSCASTPDMEYDEVVGYVVTIEVLYDPDDMDSMQHDKNILNKASEKSIMGSNFYNEYRARAIVVSAGLNPDNYTYKKNGSLVVVRRKPITE